MNETLISKPFLPGVIAFGLALFGQITLRGPLKSYGWIPYFIGVALFVFIFRHKPASRLAIQRHGTTDRLSPRPGIRLNLLIFSVVTTVISFVLFKAAYNPLAWVVHILSILLFISAFIQPPTLTWEISPGSLALLAGILLLAGIVRFWRLGEMPFGTWYDEAFNGNLATQILNNPAFRPIFFEADTLPSHLAYLWALSFRMFGAGTAALRSVTAAFGVLTVLFTYLLIRRWLGDGMGLAAAFLMAVMRYDITFSRLAMHGVTTPAFELASLYLLDRALERKQLADFAWLGLVLGLGLAFYTPFRLFTLIIVSFLLLIALVNVWRQHMTGEKLLVSAWDWQPGGARWQAPFIARIGVLVLGMFIAISPVVQFAVQKSDVFSSRMSQVSIFEKRDEPDLAKALWSNSTKHLLMFNVQGDRNGRHNLPGEPMLDPVMGTLFALGLGYALWRWRDPLNHLMLLVFFGMNLPGILSIDFEAPQSLRSIGVMPALVYFSVLPVALLTREWSRLFRPFDGKRGLSISGSTFQAGLTDLTSLGLLSLGFLGLFASIAYLNLDTYFNRQMRASDVWAVHSAAETLVAREMNSLAGSHDLVVSAMYDNHPTVRFLTGGITAYQRWTTGDRLPLIRATMDRSVVMFLDTTLVSAYGEARRLYPDAEFIEHHAPGGGSPVMYEVILTPDDFRAISGVTAHYFAGSDVEGQPASKAILPQISVDWTQISPLPGTFSAELRSTLYVPEYGAYRFSLHGGSGSALWIDEFPVGAKPLTLARGNHALRLQVPGSDNKVELWWQPPGAEQEEPLPGAYLFRPPVTNSGLLGAYYPTPDWSGEPAFMQIDPEIAFYFHIIPLPRPYTVEWTGRLYAPATGEYRFGLQSVDSSQLILDGALLVDNQQAHAMVDSTAALTKGWHDIRVRFSDQTSATQIYLYWAPPDAADLQLIPTQYLSPPMGEDPVPNDGDS